MMTKSRRPNSTWIPRERGLQNTEMTANTMRDLLQAEQTCSLEAEEQMPAEGTRKPRENKPTVCRP